MPIQFAVVAGIAVVIGIALLMVILKDWIVVVGRPNELLIFEGTSGEKGTRIKKGGVGWRNPLWERVDRLDLSLMLIELNLQDALTSNGVPLATRAIANVKITGEESNILNAVERFQGHSRSEIRRVAKETLEGALREVFAEMTPEQANQDRLEFTKQLLRSTDEDFDKLGLELDALKIQNIETPGGYLDDIGRRRIAQIIKEAEVAESDAKRAAKEVEAEAKGRGEVAQKKAKAKIQKAQNELGEFKATLKKKVESAREEAKAKGEEAENKARKELQQIRKQLEELRLKADVVIPAQAEKEAEELRARGHAAEMAERGKAMGEVMQLMADLWSEAGEDAMDVFIIQRLESILERIAETTHEVTVEEAALIDGGEGDSLPNYVSAYPKIMGEIFTQMHETTGIDITGALTGDKSNGTSNGSPLPASGSSEESAILEKVRDSVKQAVKTTLDKGGQSTGSTEASQPET